MPDNDDETNIRDQIAKSLMQAEKLRAIKLGAGKTYHDTRGLIARLSAAKLAAPDDDEDFTEDAVNALTEISEAVVDAIRERGCKLVRMKRAGRIIDMFAVPA